MTKMKEWFNILSNLYLSYNNCGKVRGADIYWFVSENTWLDRKYSDIGWGNGYIVVPKGHIAYEYDACFWPFDEDGSAVEPPLQKGWGKITDKVNGGWTWGSYNNGSLRSTPKRIRDLGEEYWILGFDTAHGWETLENWSRSRVISETKKIANEFK